MLYRNDKPFTIKNLDPNKPEDKVILDRWEEIRNMSTPIIIRQKSTVEVNETGLKEKIPNWSRPLQSTSSNENGESETWCYCEYTPKVKNGFIDYEKKSITIKRGLLSIDNKKKTDLAFFILDKTNMVKGGFYEVENLDKKNSEFVKKVGAESALTFYLCSPASPIYNEKEKLIKLGASWNVPNSDQLHIDTLRTEILSRVQLSQANYVMTQRGINEFIEEIQGKDPFAEYRSLVQISIDKKIIGFNDRDKTWYFKDKMSGEFVDSILPIGAINVSQKDKMLFDYIRSNAQLFTVLKEAIGGAIPMTKYGDDAMKYGALVKLASERGINTHGMKRPEIEAALTDLDIKEMVGAE